MSECSVKHLKWGATWPSREQFHELADAGYRVIPIVRRLLADSLTPVGFYERLAGGRSGTFILESAEYGGTWSRYSFIGVNSMAQLRSNNGQADWLGKVPVGVPVTGDVVEVAHATLKTLKAPHVEGLPNLTSGLVGTVGWMPSATGNRPCAPKLRTRPASLRPCLPWPPISPWSTTYPVRYGSSPMR